MSQDQQNRLDTKLIRWSPCDPISFARCDLPSDAERLGQSLGDVVVHGSGELGQ